MALAVVGSSSISNTRMGYPLFAPKIGHDTGVSEGQSVINHIRESLNKLVLPVR